MTVIGQDVLLAAWQKNRPLRNWLAAWVATVEAAEWQSLDELRRAYPSADGVRLKSNTVVTVFNIKGGHNRLVTWIDYQAQVVEVLEILTHAEYDKEQWKQRY